MRVDPPVLFYIILFLLLFSCEKKPPPDVTDPGQLLFLGFAKEEVNCARCHGPEGQGGTEAPSLKNVFSKYREDEILDIIDFGKGEGKDAMPAFGESLTEEELQQILQFLQQLQQAPSSSD